MLSVENWVTMIKRTMIAAAVSSNVRYRSQRFGSSGAHCPNSITSRSSGKLNNKIP